MMKLGRQTLRHFKGWLGRVYIDANREPGASLVLAGKGRSGTTWMGNIINYRGDYRYVFEPFHPQKVAVCRHFGPKKYLRPDSQDPLFAQPIDAVLRGRVRSVWTDAENYGSFRLLFRKRLIKTIRATLFLKWLHVHYPQVRIVVAVRHPCAVVASILNQGWGSVLPAVMRQQELVDDFLSPFVDQINRAVGLFEEHVFSWCIEYYVLSRQFRAGEAHFVFYERLWDRPEEEVRELFDFLGAPYDERVLEAVRTPSTTTGAASRLAIVSGEGVLGRWREQLAPVQIERCVEILGLFGLDKVYTDKLRPHEAGIRGLFPK